MSQRLIQLDREPSPPSSVQLVPVAESYMSGFDRPLFAESGIAWSFEHPYFGEIRSAGRPLRFEGEAPLQPGAYVGEHTREILTELGYGPARINDLYESMVVASPVPDWVTSPETR